MTQIITPKDAIAVVLTSKTKDFRLQLYETPLQRVTFIGSIVFIATGIVGGLCFRYTRIEWLGWLALISIVSSSVLAVAYHVAQLIPEIGKLKNPEREASNPLVEEFNTDMDLIYQLSTAFEPQHLSYARVMYSNMAKHIRERIGLLVGALDKVGIVPVTVTTYLSYAKAINNGISFGPYQWVGISFVCLYLLAIRMTTTAQWMEHIAELYDHAHTARASKALN